MSKYEQLLLEFGGGVINPHSQSEAYKKDACVAIGIGGTGIAALKKLKKRVYQQLLPDDPEAPIPTYSHIKFIAVDADNIEPGQGKGKLSKSEMFSIKNPSLTGVLGTEKGKQTIENDTRMSWMEIKNITALNTPEGAGGIRQVGRYLLISKAEELKQKIQLACTSAMQAVDTDLVTVYIFAGISGETGSGCFIDTCYIVRQLMNENGWSESGRIRGFFFLPDVVISKKEVAAIPSSVKYNNANGYAAMKELDYLMNLSQSEDHFYQKYGDFTVDTQEPPVDMCFLFSAIDAEGNVRPDGFDYCTDVAAGYVMSLLIDFTDGSADGQDERGYTLSDYYAQVNRGVMGLARTHGASRVYRVVGASSAEIPMTQISTYLAAGFMNRFVQLIGREKVNADITKQKVNEWANKLNLTPDGIMGKINHGTVSLMLPEIDIGILKSLGQMPRGKAPESWAKPGNNFLDTSEGRRTANCNGLKEDIEDYSLDKMLTGQTASIICNIFDKLYSISTDPELGPYYAAHLLHNAGYDLGKAIDGVIETYEQQKSTQELYLYGRGTGGISDDIVQVSADFIGTPLENEESAYRRYKQAVEDFFITVNRIKELEDAISVMKTVKVQLGRLYQNYYAPMIEMLDNVKESFDEDLNFLKLPKAQQATAYTWQILKLSEVQESLDQAIKALQPKALVTDFLDAVMKDYQEWINRDSDRITAFISKFMSDMFYAQVNTSLQDYLKLKFSSAATPQDLAEAIEREIIKPVFEQASAMFWCDPNFSVEAETFPTAYLSVPVSASSVCTAADNFAKNQLQTSCTVRKIGLKDRILAIQVFSGIPFYAYNGVSLLKKEYDESKGGASRAGIHLYAKTGRGSDGTGEKDWVNFLPTPSPYSKDRSMTENAEEKIGLYKKACELGIIGPEAGADKRWLLRVSKPVDERQYTLEGFMTEDAEGRVILDQVAIQSIKSNIADRLEHGWDDGELQRKIIMKNDGNPGLGDEVVAAVRMDYFLSFPNQQKIAKEEIRKHDVLSEQLKQLDAIVEEYNETQQNLKEFCGLLFYDLLESEDYSGKKSYTKIARMLYPYKKAGVPTETVLTANGKEFKYGEQYPLYQAFLTYISLDREKMPREEMLAKYNSKKEGKLCEGDNVIARTLELQWDDTAIRRLHKNVAAINEGKEIMGFYTGLVQQIREFRDKFEYEDWINVNPGKRGGSVEGETVIPTTPPQITHVYVSDGTENNMIVYLEKSKNWAWSTSRNQWVQLKTDMWVYLNNNWEPIKLDQKGSIII